MFFSLLPFSHAAVQCVSGRWRRDDTDSKQRLISDWWPIRNRPRHMFVDKNKPLRAPTHTHTEKCPKPWHVACHIIIQHADYWRQLSHLSVSACYWVFVRASLIHAGQVHQVTAHTRRFSWDRCWAWQSVNSTRHNYALTFRFHLKVFPGKVVAETFCDVSLARGCWEITWIKTLHGRFLLCVSGEGEGGNNCREKSCLLFSLKLHIRPESNPKCPRAFI